MNKQIFIFIAILISFSSCNDTVFSDRKNFDDYIWDKNNKASFNFEIKEKSHYRITLTLRYIVGYPYRNINMNFAVNGKIYPLQVNIIDENNQYTGEIMGDLADKEIVVVQDTILPKGNYKITISQSMTNKLPFVDDVGVEITRNSE